MLHALDPGVHQAAATGMFAEPRSAPELLLETKSLTETQSFYAWCAFMSGLFDFKRIEEAPSDAAFQVQAWRFGNALVSDLQYPAMAFRDSADRLRDPPYHCCVLRFYRFGSLSGLIDGGRIEMRPGELHLFDVSRPFVGRGDASAQFSVALPHSALGYDPRRHPAHIALPRNAPETTMILSCIRGLFMAGSDTDTDGKARLEDGLAALIRGLLLPTAGDDAAQSAVELSRADALRRYVEKHLLDDDLTAEKIGHMVGASRATVFRVFAQDGGVKRAILLQRLRRAVNELAAAPAERGAVSKIAEGFGFSDVNRFSRLCRRELGFAPSEIVALGEAFARSKAPPQDGLATNARPGPLLSIFN